jgi:transposase InsO family protein
MPEMSCENAKELTGHISARLLSLREVARKAEIAKDTFRGRLERFGTRLAKLSAGMMPEPAHSGDVARVIAHRETWNEGLRATAATLRIPERRVRRIFDEKDLYCYTYVPLPVNTHVMRWEAMAVGQIIHTDQHRSKYFGGRDVVAFKDSLSRRILHAGFVEDKSAFTCAQHLKELLEWLKQMPDMIFSDNGGEFFKEFRDLCGAMKITLLRSHPYTPQQNGKIERFWQDLEGMAAKPDMSLDELVSHYNSKRNEALARLRHVRSFPAYITTSDEAWSWDGWHFRGPGTETFLYQIWDPDGQVSHVPFRHGTVV